MVQAGNQIYIYMKKKLYSAEGSETIGFLLFPMCSHQVLTLYSHQVLNWPTYFSYSQCVPQYVSNSTSLYPISFALSFPLVIDITSRVAWNYNVTILGLSPAWLNFCVMDSSKTPIKTKKKKKNFGVPTTN
jgi:hypothetical protein